MTDNNPNKSLNFDTENLKEIYLAGGCFWGVEAYMQRVHGVYNVTSGYANGNTENPTYEDLIYNNSGHVEAVHVLYDPSLVDLRTLLGYYFRIIDPTSLNKQGNDQGVQYRTGIYYSDTSDLEVINKVIEKEQERYSNGIVVEVLPLIHYYLAENYHQDYLDKNPNDYCHIDLSSAEDIYIDPGKYFVPDDDKLKERLTDIQYGVTQLSETENSFSNVYWDTFEKGIYVDIVTGEPLFSSNDKYKSLCGWPSFTKAISPEVVKYFEDTKYDMTRTEVRSRVGDIHLGHVFTDGPVDRGGLRYCINSASIDFIALVDMESLGYGYLVHTIK